MGIRTRLLLLVLLPVIPALILSLRTSLDQRRLGAFRVEKDALRVAQLAAADQIGLIEATHQHLLGLSRFPQARGTNIAAFDGFFAALAQVYTNYDDFGLIETNGDLVSCRYGSQLHTNLADRAFFQRALQTRSFAVGEYSPADAQRRPALSFGQPVFDERGRVARIVYASLSLDVIDRTASKLQLPAGALLTILDRKGHILAWVPKSERLDDRSEPVSELVSNILAKTEATAQITGPDGRSRLHAFTSVPRDGDPSLLLSVGIPSELAFAEPRRLLVRNLAILGLVAIVALAGAWVLASRSILQPVRALTRTTEEVAGGNLAARALTAGGPSELGQLAQAFNQMTQRLQEQRTEAERSAQALRESEERVRLLNAELEQRVLQRTAQLQEANQELEAFSYSVSHDLRAPLRHIAGYVQLTVADAGLQLEPPCRQYLDRIDVAVKQMGQLIDDLLAFSRMARIEMRCGKVELTKLAEEVVAGFQAESQARNIEWIVHSLPTIECDPAMLRSVFANLVENAVKYTKTRERPQIEIGCESAPPEEVVVFVRDNGVGFDMEYADKLFGVFERLHRADEFEGTGIGLANVHRIISRHGGRVWADAKVGQGATFFFSLPRKE